MRKVLSFVLVLSLVLGSFSMAFAAAPSDIADSPNKEAITVGVNLGIIDGYEDGTYKPTQAVNRAEFAKLMTTALGIPDSALAGYANTSFKDVSGYQWAIPFLAFCQSKGIMVGDGNGNVRPGATISVNEAMTMMMRAVGYTENSAALVGTWPAKYVSLAKNTGMYDDIANAVTLDRANAAQVIYNGLTVGKVEVSADGTTKNVYDKNGASVTMLTSGLNCTEEKDYTVKGNEDTLISLKAFIGQKVTVFYNKDKYIVAIAGIDSTAISGEFKADDLVLTSNSSTGAIEITGTNAKFTADDDVEYTVKAKNVSYYFKNSKEVNVSTDASVATDDVPSMTAVTINAKVVGKEIREIYGITSWKVTNSKKATQADINQLKDNRLLGYDFVTNKDGSINTNSFDLVGVNALDKIALDHIVYVYDNGDNEIAKVSVGTETVTGEVSRVKGTELDAKVTVSGKEYELAGTKNGITNPPEAGDSVVLYLDAYGDIFEIDNKTNSNDLFAVVDKAAAPVKNEYRVYTSADDEIVWKVAKPDAEKVIKVASNPGLIAYSVNKDGAMATASTLGGVNTSSIATLSSISVLQVSATSSYAVDAKTVVFRAEGAKIITGVTTIDNVDTGESLGPVIYMLNKDKVVAMIVDEAKASKSSEDTYGVIDAIYSVKNKDGDAVQQVMGYANGTKFDKLTTDKGMVKLDVEVPDLWKFDIDADGNIKKATIAAVESAEDEVIEVINGGNAFKVTGGGILALAKDAVVYRAIIKDGKVDSYAVSDKSGINQGSFVYMYNTEEDETKHPGNEVVIYVTKW